MTTSRKPIALRVAKARREKGITSMYAAAKLAGIPCNSWRAVEKDGVEPSLYRAALMAEVLGVSLDWLAGKNVGGEKTLVRVEQ